MDVSVVICSVIALSLVIECYNFGYLVYFCFVSFDVCLLVLADLGCFAGLLCCCDLGAVFTLDFSWVVFVCVLWV